MRRTLGITPRTGALPCSLSLAAIARQKLARPTSSPRNDSVVKDE